MSVHTLLISIDELWLKGKNREEYFESLRLHLREFFHFYQTGPFTLRNIGQRFLFELKDPSLNTLSDELLKRLCKIPGIHTVVPVYNISWEVEDIAKTCILAMEKAKSRLLQKDQEGFFTFKVETYRTDKRFPLKSIDLSKELGFRLLCAFPDLKVKVKKPQIMIEVFIERDHCFVAGEYFIATGGLPVGSSGHAVSLISGGIDSPVASFYMAKRGLRQSFAFFHAYPYVGDEVKTKIIKLVSRLSAYQRNLSLYVIPFGKIQEEIGLKCYPEYRTVLFRLYMMKTAEMLARKIGAEALITGDGLGQVSSQTLTNLSVIDEFVKMLVLRPLVGMNKKEIIALAKKIETYEISILPHDDACALFAPKHPTTRAHKEYVGEFLQKNPLAAELEGALKNSQVHQFNLGGESTISSSALLT